MMPYPRASVAPLRLLARCVVLLPFAFAASAVALGSACGSSAATDAPPVSGGSDGGLDSPAQTPPDATVDAQGDSSFAPLVSDAPSSDAPVEIADALADAAETSAPPRRAPSPAGSRRS